MRLKSLELKGFKSFASDTAIHFDEDVIGIVGPNGSGKSNIVDAIRWVLGEQKGKELRLENMGDVIFNGTKKRKKGNVTQVSITFENTNNILPTEYQSVTISRFLYRSGESEYRLNNVPCRLKDIRSLLLDTGIGSNSYAIIALGMVDDILQDKDHARRRMFEQAAGISKYKKRKHETLLKLKNTTSDLDRVEDLLFEIESNLKALEKQARRSKRYADLKERYKTQSVQLAVQKVSAYKSKFQELSKQITIEKGVFGQLEADLNKKEAQLELIKTSTLDKEQAVSESQRELNRLVGTIRTLEHDKKLKEQRILFLQQSQDKLKSQITLTGEKIAALEVEVSTKSRALSSASKESQELHKALKSKQESHNYLQAQYEETKIARQNVSKRQLSLEEEILTLEKQSAGKQELLVQFDHLSSLYKNELNALLAEVSGKDEELNEMQSKRTMLEAELSELQRFEEERAEQILDFENQVDHAQSELKKISRTLDARKNEFALLKDMMEKLEGFPESIKFLNTSKAWHKNAPLLSDILYCEEPYRAAVEHLLEPYLNYYVVNSIEEAAQAIELLSSNQKGKANFIILNKLPAVNTNRLEIPQAQSILKYVQVEEKFQPVVDYLLGQVYLTDLNPAKEEFDRYFTEDVILIDRNGKYFRKRYSLSGGSVGLFEGKKIGRKKHLELLEKQIKKLEKKYQGTEGRVHSLGEQLEELKSGNRNVQLDACRTEIAALDQKIVSHSVFVQHKSDRIEALRGLLQELSSNKKEAQAFLESSHLALEEKRNIIKDASSGFDSADEEFNAIMAAYSDSNANVNSAHIAHVKQQNIVETIERDIHYRQEQLDELKNDLIQATDQKNKDLENIGSIEQDIDAIQDDLISNYGDKKRLEENLSEAEQNYFRARNEINELEEKVKNIHREHQNSQYLINQLKDEHQNLRFKLASVSERLKIEFGVTLEEALEQEIEATTELEELEEKIFKLKRRLDNYGEINPMAVEAYEEMKERYETINLQREDIMEAKTSLLQTIKEIEVTATEKFLSAFEKAREYFIEVFRSLFTEDDSCDLLLTDMENPLDSDIRIIAKPKGKRPKSLSQLSGGEKTLTATALLFSLYLLKPAPFCIFDEVDAPLDDANVEKFNRIIKKFSQDSQFIIVTHNKQTMAAVDVIYGVYMEEQGISSLSPVDLRGFQYQGILETVAN